MKEYVYYYNYFRNLKDIYILIEKSDLFNFVKKYSKNVFYDIVKVEVVVY